MFKQEIPPDAGREICPLSDRVLSFILPAQESSKTPDILFGKFFLSFYKRTVYKNMSKGSIAGQTVMVFLLLEWAAVSN